MMGRARRWLPSPAILVVLALLAVSAGGSCYVSGRVHEDALQPDHSAEPLDVEVVALDGGRVTLRASGDSRDEIGREGVWGLAWDGGYALLGATIESTDGDTVTRSFETVEGVLNAGERARTESYAFPGDPLTAHGLPFKEVEYQSPLGPMPAWLVEGTGSTWLIFVHGKGGERREGLRLLPPVARAGLPALFITYRNDPGVPPDPGGLYGYGATEWKDLEGAVTYALENGAEDVVLAGYSMGGAIVMSFLYRSNISDAARGAILDSPVLDFAATVEFGLRDGGVPGPLTGAMLRVVGIRYDVYWDFVDYLDAAEALQVPLLLFHGDEDDLVPVATSRDMAAARPDLVTYVEVPGTAHVRSWNAGPQAYEAKVEAFLRDLLAADPP